jgi:hypothetical protein
LCCGRNGESDNAGCRGLRFYISFHQWEHGGKPSKLSCPTDPVISTLNFIRPNVLAHYQICTSLTSTESKSCDLLHHKAVRCLSLGRLLPGISLLRRHEDHLFQRPLAVYNSSARLWELSLIEDLTNHRMDFHARLQEGTELSCVCDFWNSDRKEIRSISVRWKKTALGKESSFITDFSWI